MRIAVFLVLWLYLAHGSLISMMATTKSKSKGKGKGKGKGGPAKKGGFGMSPAAKKGFGADDKSAVVPFLGISQQQYDRAVAAKVTATTQNPEDAQSWLELGALMVKGREYGDAERIFRAGAARVPAHEMLSAAALTLGGDSAAYHTAEPPARLPPPAREEIPPELCDSAFEAYEAPWAVMESWDQCDRAANWPDRDTLGRRGCVFKSKGPLIDPADCAWLIREVEDYAAKNGGWSTARHVQVPGVGLRSD